MTTLDNQLFDLQARIQRSARRATLMASYTPSPDFDPPTPFRRQAIPQPPPQILRAHTRFASAAVLPKTARIPRAA